MHRKLHLNDIMIKLKNVKDKEKIFKADTEKLHTACQGIKI